MLVFPAINKNKILWIIFIHAYALLLYFNVIFNKNFNILFILHLKREISSRDFRNLLTYKKGFDIFHGVPCQKLKQE